MINRLTDREFFDRAKELGVLYGEKFVECRVFNRETDLKQLEQIQKEIDLCISIAKQVGDNLKDANVMAVARHINETVKAEENTFKRISPSSPEKINVFPNLSIDLRTHFPKVLETISKTEFQWRTILEAKINFQMIEEICKPFLNLEWFELLHSIDNYGNYSVKISKDKKEYINISGKVTFEEV